MSDAETWKLITKLAVARAALETAHKRIKYYEDYADSQLEIIQQTRRQMRLLNIKELV